MKIKLCGSFMTAFVAIFFAVFAAVPKAETVINTGLVIGPSADAQITGGIALSALADSILHEIVTTLSMEVRGENVSNGTSVGVWRYTLPPGTGPSMRAHRDADQFLYVVRGRFEFLIGERIWRAIPGSIVFIPKKVPHSYTNVDNVAGVLVGGVMPAGFEKYFLK